MYVGSLELLVIIETIWQIVLCEDVIILKEFKLNENRTSENDGNIRV